MLRPTANEIPQLIRRLGSPDPSRVDAARARLAILGARAVEHLIEALEGSDRRIRERVMPLLALISDPRGRGPLIATLLDGDPRIREAAADSLARFPAPVAVAALERILRREPVEAVRVAAVRALVEQCAAGRDDAVRRPLELLLDPAEAPTIRSAAFALVRTLPAAQRRGILARLAEDPSAEIRRLAHGFEAELREAAEPVAGRILALVQDLASVDYATWNAAVRRLGRAGSAIVAPLVAEMSRRPSDAEFATRAGMALKALGRRHARPIADALDEVADPVALHVLVDVIGAVGEPSLVYRIKDLLDRLAGMTVPTDFDGAADAFRRVRARAHLELARIGSRVAIQDLREALADPTRGIELELLGAVEIVGKREEIPVLLGTYGREDPFGRARIADVVRSIMKRERIRRDDRTFQTLGTADRESLGRILPRPARRRAATIARQP